MSYQRYLLFLLLVLFNQCIPEIELQERTNFFDPEGTAEAFTVYRHYEVDEINGKKVVAIEYALELNRFPPDQQPIIEWVMVYKDGNIRYPDIALGRTRIVERNLPSGVEVCYQFSVRTFSGDESKRSTPYCFRPD
ncbi:MAG: hypothetical protein AAFW73_16000 [Bacteroidota bacterium]